MEEKIVLEADPAEDDPEIAEKIEKLMRKKKAKKRALERREKRRYAHKKRFSR